MALELGICSSGLAGARQLTARATLPNFAFLAFLCPVAWPSPRGTGSSQRDSKPNPHARNRRAYQGRWIKGWLDEIATNAQPGRPPGMANFARFGILTAPGNPLAPRCQGIWGNKVALSLRDFILEGQRVDCFASALVWPGRGVNFQLF